MPQRGVYRGVFANLVDDPDFQALPSHARHVLLTIRLSQDIGPAGIFRFYVGPLVERTGYQEKKVEDALDELEKPKPGEDLGWIVRDSSVLWVVNALRHDPTIKLADPKHRTCVIRSISGLPKSDIVLKFCEYYKIPRAFDGPSRTPNLKSDFCSPNPIPNPNPNPNPNKKILSIGFADLWALYPMPKGLVGDARKAWKVARPPEDVLAILQRQVDHQDRCAKNGTFWPRLPYLAKWIKGKQWEMELPSNGNGKTPSDPYSLFAEAWSCAECGKVHESKRGDAHVCPLG